MRLRPLLLRPPSSDKEPGTIGIRLLPIQSLALCGLEDAKVSPSRPCSFPRCAPLALEVKLLYCATAYRTHYNYYHIVKANLSSDFVAHVLLLD